MTTPQSKSRLRDRLQSIRRDLDDERIARASESVVERLRELPEISAARTVLAYWPMPLRRELDIRPLLRDLAAAGVTVGLPVIGRDAGDRSMAFARLGSEADLVPGPFGTRHPSGDPVDAADVVIVPALAATRSGHRLGYGGGYYDRFLGESGSFTVVPLYSACLVDSLPIQPHDVPVDAVITEHEEIRTRRRA